MSYPQASTSPHPNTDLFDTAIGRILEIEARLVTAINATDSMADKLSGPIPPSNLTKDAQVVPTPRSIHEALDRLTIVVDGLFSSLNRVTVR